MEFKSFGRFDQLRLEIGQQVDVAAEVVHLDDAADAFAVDGPPFGHFAAFDQRKRRTGRRDPEMPQPGDGKPTPADKSVGRRPCPTRFYRQASYPVAKFKARPDDIGPGVFERVWVDAVDGHREAASVGFGGEFEHGVEYPLNARTPDQIVRRAKVEIVRNLGAARFAGAGRGG